MILPSSLWYFHEENYRSHINHLRDSILAKIKASLCTFKRSLSFAGGGYQNWSRTAKKLTHHSTHHKRKISKRRWEQTQWEKNEERKLIERFNSDYLIEKSKFVDILNSCQTDVENLTGKRFELRTVYRSRQL